MASSRTMLIEVWPVATPFLYQTLPVAALLVSVTDEVPPFSQKGCAVPLTVIDGVAGTGLTVIVSVSVKFCTHPATDGVALTVSTVDAVVGVTGITRDAPLPPTIPLTAEVVL